MSKLKERIIILASVATIVTCCVGSFLALPPALVALRQLEDMVSQSTPTIRPSLVDVPDVATETSTQFAPTVAVQLSTPTRLPTITLQPPAIPRPTATSMPPTPKPTSSPSSCAQGNLTGRVESEIPGTSTCVGVSVSSVIDVNTKPKDVYSINLVAGQEVLFKITAPNSFRNTILYNPGSKSIEANQVSTAFYDSCSNGWTQTFTPAISGTYYFVITAYGSSQTYTLSLTAMK